MSDRLDALTLELSALLRQLDARGGDDPPTLAAIDHIAAEVRAERLGNGDAWRAAARARAELALSPANLKRALIARAQETDR